MMVIAMSGRASLSGAGWGLLIASGLVFLAGVALGARALVRPEGRRRTIALPGAVLIAAGLLGVVLVATVGPGGGFMGMMRGDMGSMMGGRPGRSGSPPAQAAPQTTISAREFAFSPNV